MILGSQGSQSHLGSPRELADVPRGRLLWMIFPELFSGDNLLESLPFRMATLSPESSARSNLRGRSKPMQLAGLLLPALALVYALLAGLHTLQDFDLGWQVATGRWVLQHRHIFSADVFSYT